MSMTIFFAYLALWKQVLHPTQIIITNVIVQHPQYIKCYVDKSSHCVNIHERVRECLMAYLGQVAASTTHS